MKSYLDFVEILGSEDIVSVSTERELEKKEDIVISVMEAHIGCSTVHILRKGGIKRKHLPIDHIG